MSDKKILIIAPFGFNDRMTNFIEFISARVLAQHGWNVVAMAKSDSNTNSHEVISGIQVYHYKNLLSGILTLIKIWFTFKPALTHIHNLRNSRVGVVAAMLAHITVKPFCFTEYGLLHDHYLTDDRDNPLPKTIHYERVVNSLRDFFKKSISQPKKSIDYFKSYIYHWALFKARAVVFVSKHNQNIAEKLGIKDISVLPHILDNERWAIKIPEQSAHLKAVEETLDQINRQKNVLFIGQLKLRKGWDVFLKSIPHIPTTVIDNFIFITGSSTTPPPEVTDLMNKLGITERVVFLGKVSSSELMRKAYDVSTVVVVPSRYEGFGLATVEAFEMKRPLIAANVAALTDTVIDGKNGLLFEPENHEALAQAVVTLTTNSELQNKLIAGGTETLQTLKSPEAHKIWLNFYDNFLKS